VLPEDMLMARGTAEGLEKLQRAARGEVEDLD